MSSSGTGNSGERCLVSSKHDKESLPEEFKEAESRLSPYNREATTIQDLDSQVQETNVRDA